MHHPLRPARGARTQAAAWLAALALPSLLGACSAPEPLPPLPPPRVVRSVSHQAGGVLADGQSPGEHPGSTQPWIATLHLVALESLPDRGEPLVDHLRLISKSNSPRLLETRLDLLAGARRELLDEPAAALAASLASARATSCGRLRAALLPETATVFQLSVDRFAQADTAREGLSLRLARWGDQLEVALVAQRAAPGAGEFLEVTEEAALLERLDPGQGLLLLVPAHFDPGYAGYALALDCAPARSAADLHLVSEARVQRLGASSAPISSQRPVDRAPRAETLAKLRAPDPQPSEWSALAEEVGAGLSERLILAGDAALLEAVLGEWQSALQGPALDLGWSMERASIRALLERETPWGRALLLERCGALGSDPAALRDTLDLASDIASWEEQLRRENRHLLSNALASARARAFGWLRARGLAPTDYDPFASREARRSALRKAGS
jgi:hypothetical protein